MSEFNIQSAVEEDVCHIRLTGRLTFAMSRRFDAFIEETFNKPPADIIIDLRKTEYMDSTILGLLAKIARRFITHHNRKPTLLSTREDTNILLESMGFDAAFEIRSSAESVPFYLEDIPLLEKSDPMPETLLEAHETLMDLDERNVDRFSTTVKTLREVVERGSA